MTLADISLAQFQRRRAWLARQVSEGRLAAPEADRRLLPWLHVACLAGADLPDFTDAAGQAVPIPTGPAVGAADRAAALRELALARNAALDSPLARPVQTDQARELVALAAALGCPPYPLTDPVIPANAGTQSQLEEA